MPHPDLGVTAGFFGGGGIPVGLPQAVWLREFSRAGIKFDQIWAVSVGTFNGWDPENALSIWENNFSSPWAVSDLNPDLKRFVNKLYNYIPIRLLRKHKTWKDSLSDWSHYRKNYKSSAEFFTDIWNVLGYIRQIATSMPSIPLGEEPAPKDLVPILERLMNDLKFLRLQNTESFLDPSPLIKTLRETVDLNRVFERKTPFQSFARSGDQHYIFSCGEQMSAKTIKKLSYKYLVHQIRSADELCLASMASSAIRPFYSPVKIDDKYFWDSGTINPYPVKCAMDAGADTVFAFVKNYYIYDFHERMNVYDAVVEDGDMAARTVYSYQYDRAVEFAKKKEKKLYTIRLSADHPDIKLLQISPAGMNYTVRKETQAARKWLKDNLSVELGLSPEAEPE